MGARFAAIGPHGQNLLAQTVEHGALPTAEGGGGGKREKQEDTSLKKGPRLDPGREPCAGYFTLLRELSRRIKLWTQMKFIFYGSVAKMPMLW